MSVSEKMESKTTIGHQDHVLCVVYNSFSKQKVLSYMEKRQESLLSLYTKT